MDRSGIVRRVKDYLSLDLRSLAVLRVGVAILLLADLATRATSLREHYTDAGILPRSALPTVGRLSIHTLSGAGWFQAVLFAVAALAALALLVGYRTRLATLVSWFLLLSLHGRNSLVLQGGDMVLRLLLFWGMFLPLGACWSVDSRRSKPPLDYRVLSMGGAALLLQICFIYWFTATLKSSPVWRTEGTAVWYALSLDAFATPLGKFLLGFPGLLRVLTFATLWFEFVGPALWFVPWRKGPIRTGVVAAFVLFHVAGLARCMTLGLFSYVCAVAWLALLPGWFWEKWAGYLALPRWPVAAEAGPPRRRRAWEFTGAAVAGLCLVYVLLCNLISVNCPLIGRPLPQPVQQLAVRLGLSQKWSMFAPFPLRRDGWYVVPGKLADGARVDVLHGGAPVSWAKPALLSATFADQRWRKLLMNLANKDYARYRRPFTRWLWNDWNRRHGPGQQLVRLDLYFMAEITRPDGEAPPQKRRFGRIRLTPSKLGG